MVVGTIISIVLMFILSIPARRRNKLVTGRRFLLGYYLDPNFNGFKLPKGRVGLYTLLAGCGSYASFFIS